jgi:hypothetical protein
MGLDHIERAGGGGQDLGEQFIRVERHRCDQLLEFRHRELDVGGLVHLQLRNESGWSWWRRGNRHGWGEFGLGVGGEQ